MKRLSLRVLLLFLSFIGIVNAQTVNIQIPDSSGVVGTRVYLPILVLTDVTGLEIYSYQFSVCFDSNIIRFVKSDAAGTMSENWESNTNAIAPDTVRIGAYTANSPLTGAVVLRFLTFDLIGQAESQTPIIFCPPDTFFFNSGSPAADFSGGTFTLRSNFWVTVDTNPSVLDVEVDEVAHSTPHTFEWVPQSIHSLKAPSPQSTNESTRYLWNNWSDGGDSIHTIVVESDSIFIAYYDTQYRLTTLADPSDGGSIDVVPEGPWYDPGTSVQLTANASEGTIFTNWSRDLTGSTNPDHITMDGPKNVTAHFARLVNITVTTDPESLEIRIDGGEWQRAPWTGQWTSGSEHSIETNRFQSGEPGTRFVWERWSDDGDYSHPVVAPDTNATYTVYFNTQYLLTTTVNPEGGGSIEVNPAGPWYSADSTVIVNAIPNEGYVFSEWNGDLSGSTNPETLVMDTSKTVIANFSSAMAFISGIVNYAISMSPVKTAAITLSGGASDTQVTGDDGLYNFSSLTIGLNYTVTPSKINDYDSGDIMMYDASLAAQHAVGLLTLSANQQWAADVDKNDLILMYDASLIAMCSVGLEPPPESHTSEWEFAPVGMSYNPLDSDRTNQDYDAVLLGDVDGNWQTSTLLTKQVKPFKELLNHLADYKAKP